MRLVVGAAPHLRHNDDIRITMGDMIVPMVPIALMAFYFYGTRVLVLTLISIVSCVVLEYLYRRILGKPRSIGDLSAVITGFILAYNMPASAPLWFPVAGAFFAVIIVKQLFGGIGKNVFNPALGGILFLTVTWPGIMSSLPLPFNQLSVWGNVGKFETGRSALSALKAGQLPDNKLFEMLLGNQPGYFGACAVLVLLAGGLYLLYRRIISWTIPVSFVGTVALISFIFPRSPAGRLDSMLFEILSGSLIFAALFIATDPVTSPVTNVGRLLYGFFCGLITVLIRYTGIYPEGAYFAIFLMNPFVLALDRLAWKLKTKKGGHLNYAEE